MEEGERMERGVRVLVGEKRLLVSLEQAQRYQQQQQQQMMMMERAEV